MGISSLLDIGKSALMANQVALQVTGQNISNVSTTGYSKQEVVLEAANPMDSRPGQIGMGVKASEIKRDYDSFIENEIISQQHTLGYLGASSDAASQVEQVFNDTSNTGIGSAINDFFSAVQDLSNNPSGSAERTALVAKANTLTQFVQQSYSDLSSIRASADQDISDEVGNVNSTASQIAQLNQQISGAEAEGQNPNDLLDQRTQLMENLAGSVDYSSYEDASGQVNIVLGGGVSLVEGSKAFSLKAEKGTSDGMTVVEYDNGSGGLQNITSSIKSGKLAGLIDARDTQIPKYQDGLDNLAASITNEVNKVNGSGYGLDGSTGVDFFTPLGATAWSGNNAGTGSAGLATVTDYTNLSLDQFQVTFTSSSTYDLTDSTTGSVVSTGNSYTSGGAIAAGGMSFSITGAPDTGDTFNISAAKGAASNFSVSQAVSSDTSKIAAATDPAMLPGDNRNAMAMAALQDSPEVSGTYTFSDYYSSLVSDSGVESQQASTQSDFQNGLLQNLQSQKAQVSGVSLDEETTNLLKYQRAYEAAAKVISIADTLMDELIKM